MDSREKRAGQPEQARSKPRPYTTDILIIGAGVSGLAAARRLNGARLPRLVLEARARAGGRIYTHHEPDVPLPIELGAEFLHGDADETVSILRDAQIPIYEVLGEHRNMRGRSKAPANDFWSAVEEVMKHMDPKRARDRSFAEFLATAPGGRRLAKARMFAREFVEGFHAADATRISERALAVWAASDDDDSRARRVLPGYDALINVLLRSVSGQVHFNTVVTRIDWEPGHVTATTPDNRTFTARAAVITVPLGLLQADGVFTIVPAISSVQKALSGLAMGIAERAVCWFREPFWEMVLTRRGRSQRPDAGAHGDHLSFLHGDDEHFPIWWTTFPVHAPMITGWAGGPRAARLTGVDDDTMREYVTKALARTLHVTRRHVEQQLLGVWFHDWATDPFSLGAYSYPAVGGANAARALAKPVEGTLFFAGEATVWDGRNGTVDGAIASGHRAAKALIAMAR